MLGSLGITRQFVDYLPLSSRSDPTTQCPQVGPRAELKQKSKRVSCSQFVTPFAFSHKGRTLVAQLKVHATTAETSQPKWWEKNGPNMVDIHSAQEFVDALSQAEDRLVIVDFYGTWCASCRALFPKLCRLAQDHPEILFLKVDFDQNKSLCKSLNIKVLPYFHFYRGADRLVDSFSCSLAKIQKLKDAIAAYNVKNYSSQISPNDSNDGSVSQNS